MVDKIIFDCDNTLGIPFKEVDDGLTLLYLLGVSVVNLLGITTTFGNGSIDQVYDQTQYLINRVGVPVPLFKGEGKSDQGSETSAAHFLVKAVDDSPCEITILATGPLGNLYAASQLDPDFYQKVKGIVLMGGYLGPVKLGYRDLGELNLSANPRAAFSVLYAPCQVTLFSAQACLDAPFRLEDILKVDFWPGKLKWVLLQWLIGFGLYTGKFVFYLWDLLPAVYLVKPELFEMKSFRIGSSLQDLESGMLIEGRSSTDPDINLAMGIRDQRAFFDHLDTVWRISSQKYPLNF